MQNADFYDAFRAVMTNRDTALEALRSEVSRVDPGVRPIVERIVEQNVAVIFAHSESPIERLFFSTVAQGFLMFGKVGVFRAPVKDAPMHIAESRFEYMKMEEGLDRDIRSIAWNFNLQAEFPNQRIRVDLLVWRASNLDPPIIVECDGFDYHSDRDAFTRDRRRDRMVQSLGYRVIRFSGSEIHKNPIGSACELLKLVFGHKHEDIGEQSPLRDEVSRRTKGIVLLENLLATLTPGTEDFVAVSGSLDRMRAY